MGALILILILILTVILEYVQQLFQMERFVGLSLKQGMENRGIGESGGIVLIYNTNLYLNWKDGDIIVCCWKTHLLLCLA